MGCSPSMIRPEPCGKEPLTCANGFIDSQKFHYQQRFTSPDNENNNENNNRVAFKHNLDMDNNNAVVNETRHQNKNLSKTKQTDTREETDSANIVPVISNEERCFSTSQSPLNVHLLRRHYHEHSNHHSTHHSHHHNNDSHNNDSHNGRKSVLKSSASGVEDHMLANRPLKTVTFVDSVTVITVF